MGASRRRDVRSTADTQRGLRRGHCRSVLASSFGMLLRFTPGTSLDDPQTLHWVESANKFSGLVCPSGIPSVTVETTVYLRSVPAFPPSSAVRIPRPFGHGRENQKHPFRGTNEQAWKEHRTLAVAY